MDRSTVAETAKRVSTALNSEIVYYAGPINRLGYEVVSSLCSQRGKDRGVLLLLVTQGGDADAGYRIARALRHNHGRLAVLVPRACKSAGTLIACGATELIIGDRGELGPLDVQLRKQDEIFEYASGLDVTQALTFVQQHAMDAFRGYMLEIKLGSGITSRMAAEIATKLVVGLFSPVFAHIDPVRLGEVQRAISIAHAYAERLNRYDSNLKPGSLESLVTAYPSHGFVIDRKEARELFRRVYAPSPDQEALAEYLISLYQQPRDNPVVIDVLANFQEEQDDATDEACEPAVPAAAVGEGNAARS